MCSLTIADPVERAAFTNLTAGLHDSAVPYVKVSAGNYGSERALQALLILLRSFIDVERNFASAPSYADAVTTLRTLSTPPADIMKMVRSHSQLNETSRLAELLITDVIGDAAVATKVVTANNSQRKKSVVEGAHSLFAAMPCLSEIGKLSGSPTYASIASKARKLLLQETVPSISRRSNGFARAARLAAVATEESEKCTHISKFVEKNEPMTDIFLDSLAECTDPILLATFIRIYLEKTYRVYELNNFVYDEGLGVCTFNFKLKSENSDLRLHLKKVRRS